MCGYCVAATFALRGVQVAWRAAPELGLALPAQGERFGNAPAGTLTAVMIHERKGGTEHGSQR